MAVSPVNTSAFTPTTLTSLSSLGSTGSAGSPLAMPGVGSNLDVTSIVNALMQVEQAPLNDLNQKEASYDAQLSAYGTVKGALSSLQSALATLNSLSTFQATSVTASDTSIVTASADSSATLGSYAVQVAQLAQAQTLVTAGQASTTQSIGSGTPTTITFQFGTITGGTLSNGTYSGATFTQDGTAASGTVTIDSTNDSLQGIRDAINAADIGVTASIVNDGSGSPYRLLLQSSSTGAASSMNITVSGDAALAGLLSYDPSATQNLTQVVAAQSAQLSVNGFNLTSSSNTVNGAIQGVTFNLAKTGSTTVTIAQDSSGASAAVQAFVSAYNTLVSTISQVASYDPTTQKGGPLLGDAALQTIQAQLRNILGAAIPGSTGGLSSLAQIGVSFQQDGTLTLNTSQLQAALSAGASNVARLFTSLGNTTDSLVSYVSSTADTVPGRYAVNVTALATQGTLTGSSPAGLIISAGVNDQLALTIDGVTGGVTLAPGTYTPDSLAVALQAAINGAPAFSAAGIGVTVSQAGGVLTIQSNSYGLSSSVSVSGSAAQSLFGPTPVATAGTDVAGTINGAPALGSGQFLTAAAGSAAAGLKIQIRGGALGARGQVNFSQGYAYQLSAALTNILSDTGPLAASTDGINASISDIDNQRNALNARLTQVQQNYLAQFTALDTLISNMNSTASFLAQQLAILPAPGTVSGSSKA